MYDGSPRTVIFGGSGFIGTRLAQRLLSAGCQVRIADLVPSAEFPHLWVECDIRNYHQVLSACQDMQLVFNLAAEHADNVRPLEKYRQVNVHGTRIVCQATEQAGIKRLIFTSSVAVYGLADRELDETAPPAPFNEYGRTKLLGEKVCLEWARGAADRALVIVRPTVVFGENNRGNFYNLLRQIASRRFVMVGAGRNRKSIAYVENVAAFLQFVMQLEAGEHLFNYADKPDMQMNELVPLILGHLGMAGRRIGRLPYWLAYSLGKACDAVACVTGRKLTLSAVRVKKFCANTQFSARKALDLGFVPPVELATAVRRTVEAEFGRPGQASA
jgi:nucleoside-diphosphate-sugar epimerase